MGKQKQTQKSTLTIGKINKEAKSYQEKEVFEFSNGETIKIHTRFGISKIEEMFEEYGKILDEIEKNTEEEFSEKLQLYFLYFMIIKHFTDLKSKIPNDAVKAFSIFKNMIETFYFKELIDEGFPKEEIHKVLDMATDIAATYDVLERFNNRLKDKIEQLDLKNKDVLFPNSYKDEDDAQTVQEVE